MSRSTILFAALPLAACADMANPDFADSVARSERSAQAQATVDLDAMARLFAEPSAGRAPAGAPMNDRPSELERNPSAALDVGPAAIARPDFEALMDFRTMGDDERMRAIDVARGSLFVRAMGALEQLDADAAADQSGCFLADPGGSGTVTLVADGCTGPSGRTWTGMVEVLGATSLELETAARVEAPPPEISTQGVVLFHDLNIVDGDGRESVINGALWVSQHAAINTQRRGVLMMIDTPAQRSVALWAETCMDLGGERACMVDKGSKMDLSDLGRADMYSEIVPLAAGRYTATRIEGRDALWFLHATDPDGCVFYTVDDDDRGSLCE